MTTDTITKTTTDLTVASEIMKQLGGKMFQVMTGAKMFLGGSDFVQFRLPGNFAKDGINSVRITLEASDTYKMEFFRIRGTKFSKIAESVGIYFDMIQKEFTAATGLDCHL